MEADSKMEAFETTISKAVTNGTAPGVAAIAIDKNGLRRLCPARARIVR